ncbi:MAG: hypothetical protein OXH43_13330, partial [Acidimicrobiaceae bacterium]|nr:hypothetical protein [Acidimicrobiaceae bacterium]
MPRPPRKRPKKAARQVARRDEQSIVAARSGWSTVDQGSMVVVEEELDDDFIVDPVYDADDRNWVRYRP